MANIPTINEKFLDSDGNISSTWYSFLRSGSGSTVGDVVPNFFILPGAYIQESNYWLNLSVDNGWLSGLTYQGAYEDLLNLSNATNVYIRFISSDARDTEILTYGESGAFVLDTNNKRFKIPMITKSIGNLETLSEIGTVVGNSAATGTSTYAYIKFPYFMKVGNKAIQASSVDLKKEAADQKAAISALGQEMLEAISTAGETATSNVESAGETQLTAINAAGTIQVDGIILTGTTWKNDIISTGTLWNNNIVSTGSEQVGLVNTAGDTQVGLVNTAGDTQVGLVNSAGATQIGLVEGEGNTQVARVISEGTSYVTAAQNWAIKTDGPVSGSDYSSKYNANLAYTYAQSVNPDNIVHIAGAETITGVKTFSSSPIVPTPTTDYQTANKKYVDENKGGSGLPLFASLYLDYNPENSGYVLSDGSSYVSGDVYSAAYDHLVVDYTNGTSDSETVGGVSVTYRRAADGHKIIDVANIANYISVLSATGTAWYYVLDQANTRFMLPFTNWFIQGGATTAGSLAAYQAAGLPNITGYFSALLIKTTCSTTIGIAEINGGGAFHCTSTYDNKVDNNSTSGNSYSASATMTLNASSYNAIYGSSTTVQPQSNKLGLYFVCGNTVVNQDLIDVAGLADKDLNNITDIALTKIANPITTIIMSPLATPPPGYLLCDGSAISRTYYADLFTALGTLYGVGNGSTTFNLPDFRGCFLRGYDGARSAAVGTSQTDGLPNITGLSIPPGIASDTIQSNFSGAFYSLNTGQKGGVASDFATNSVYGFGFNASKSNAIYGKSNYVTPLNHAIYYFIKY